MMQKKEYEIFISYRRLDEQGNISGRDQARLIAKQLELEGYHPFFDYSEIKDDEFDKVIIPAVENCKVFILVLTKDALSRCKNEGDWVRKEIETAIKSGSKVINVSPDNSFNGWPDTMPESLYGIKNIQISDIHFGSLFELSINKLIDDRIASILPRHDSHRPTIRRWLRLPQQKSSFSNDQEQSVDTNDIEESGSHNQSETSEAIVSHPQAIDLGLPSGTKWSACNVGAEKPEEFGSYFAWGETEAKSRYSWKNYTHCDGDKGSCHNIGSDIVCTKYDVAHMKWGGNWRTPTLDQIKELLDNCHSKWTTLNGVKGRKFMSKINGNSIFLPAAGNRINVGLYNSGDLGNYWSSTLYPSDAHKAYNIQLCSDDAGWNNTAGRFSGFSVRPVLFSLPQSIDLGLPHPHHIDLGLPSGTKWASCNMGATKPEEYGGYYAWGEIEVKKRYDWDTYDYCDGDENSCFDIGSDIAGTHYDAAHIKWGGNWRLPSLYQIKELLFNCTNEHTTLNGVNGVKFISKINGKSIFFPSSGFRKCDSLYYVNKYGVYWSSMILPSSSSCAQFFEFKSNGNFVLCNDCYRYCGHTIRPVLSQPHIIDLRQPHPHLIDLGLPSGTKWASCNVGATMPEEYGGYFAWGETEEKKKYDKKTYAHNVGFLKKSYRDIGSDIVGTKYDIAHKKWGGNWRMPTIEQYEELLIHCNSEWATLNGVKGLKFTSMHNGNSIFLPAAGQRRPLLPTQPGSIGLYWSSTQELSDLNCAYSLIFNLNRTFWNGSCREQGFTVRPVSK